MMATITARIIKTPIVINDEIKICDWPPFAGEDLVDSLILVPKVEIHKEKVIFMCYLQSYVYILTFTSCASCLTFTYCAS